MSKFFEIIPLGCSRQHTSSFDKVLLSVKFALSGSLFRKRMALNGALSRRRTPHAMREKFISHSFSLIVDSLNVGQ